MSQDKFFRKELAKELNRIEALMKKESSVEKKIYYFSAAYGATSRTFRYSFSRDVLLADFVLQTCYNLLVDRVNRIKSGDNTVEVDKINFEKICEGLKILAERVENNENIQEPLELLITTAFSTTGPGNYIREKGEMDL
jgi:hypothetical protein